MDIQGSQAGRANYVNILLIMSWWKATVLQKIVTAGNVDTQIDNFGAIRSCFHGYNLL